MIASAPQVLAIAGLFIYLIIFLGALSGMFALCRAAVRGDDLDRNAERWWGQ